MNKIQRLINQNRFQDAAALAIYENKTYETRLAFSKHKLDDDTYELDKFNAFEDLLLADAAKDFDVYNRFLDYRQPLHRNLYLDRRKYLKDICDTITNMFFPKEDEISYDVIRIKLRTRSAKSEIFNRAQFWVQSNFPRGESLHCVGGGKLKVNIHDKRLAFIDEYWSRHSLVFPDIEVVRESKDMTAVWFSNREYADISTVTVGGSIEGHVQVTNLLIMDDLVSSNEINSPKRLEDIYSSDIMNAISRRIVGSPKVILVGTPFPTTTGIKDPLDRYYENRMNAGGIECKEFIVPSLDENGESNYAYRNFDKMVNGKPLIVFSTEALNNERNAAYNSGDPFAIAAYETIYQMKPMELGIKRFTNLLTYETVPDGKYKELNWLDPADAGDDYAVFHHCRIYDAEPNYIYLYDTFRTKTIMDRRKNGGYLDDLVEFMMKYDVHKFDYEANMGGTLLGETIVEIANEHNYMMTYDSHKQTKNKNQRINDWASELLNTVKVQDVPSSKMYQESLYSMRAWTEKTTQNDDIDALTSIVELNFGGVKPVSTFLLMSKPIM